MARIRLKGRGEVMAQAQRLNITIPEELHAKLEPLRDRINISKVCTMALQEEVERLTTDPEVEDPRVAEILARLVDQKDLWYERGYTDGEAWAMNEATRAQLEYHAGRLAGLAAEELARHFDAQDREHTVAWFPLTASIEQRWMEWLLDDQMAVKRGLSGSEMMSQTMKDLFGEEPEDPSEIDPNRQVSLTAYGQMGAYLQGWRDAVGELWEKVARALERSKVQGRPKRKEEAPA